MHTDAIIGLVMGIVALCLALILLLLVLCRIYVRGKKKDPEQPAKPGYDNPMYGQSPLDNAVQMKDFNKDEEQENGNVSGSPGSGFTDGRERIPSGEISFFVGQSDKEERHTERSNSFTNPLFDHEEIPSLASQISVDLMTRNPEGPMADLALDLETGTMRIHGVPDDSPRAYPSRTPESQRKVTFSDVIQVKDKSESSSTLESLDSTSASQSSDLPESPKKTPPPKPSRAPKLKSPSLHDTPLSHLGVTIDAKQDNSFSLAPPSSEVLTLHNPDFPDTPFASTLSSSFPGSNINDPNQWVTFDDSPTVGDPFDGDENETNVFFLSRSQGSVPTPDGVVTLETPEESYTDDGVATSDGVVTLETPGESFTDDICSDEVTGETNNQLDFISDSMTSFVNIRAPDISDSSVEVSGEFLETPNVEQELMIDTSSNIATPLVSPGLSSPITVIDRDGKEITSSGSEIPRRSEAEEGEDENGFTMVESPEAIYAQVMKEPIADMSDSLQGCIAGATPDINTLPDEDLEDDLEETPPTLPPKRMGEQLTPEPVEEEMLGRGRGLSGASEDDEGYVIPLVVRSQAIAIAKKSSNEPSGEDSEPTFPARRLSREYSYSDPMLIDGHLPTPDAGILSSSCPDMDAPLPPEMCESIPEYDSESSEETASDSEPPPLPERPASMLLGQHLDLSASFETIQDEDKEDLQDVLIGSVTASSRDIPDFAKAIFQPESEFAERLKRRKEKLSNKQKGPRTSKKKRPSLTKSPSVEKPKKKKSSSSKRPPSIGFDNPLYEESSSNAALSDTNQTPDDKTGCSVTESEKQGKNSSPTGTSDSEIERISDDMEPVTDEILEEEFHNISDTQNIVESQEE